LYGVPTTRNSPPFGVVTATVGFVLSPMRSRKLYGVSVAGDV
jgi:hypothetical protein